MHNLEERSDKEKASAFTIGMPWHGLGHVLDNPLTAEEAVEAANMGFEVKKYPNQVVVGDDIIKHEDSFSVVREDLKTVLASKVGTNYTPLQNMEAFNFFDEFTQTGEAIYQSGGVLGGGERTWLLAKIPDNWAIRGKEGEEIDRFVVLANSFDGKSSVKIATTNVRVVCSNTLNLALESTKNMVNIPHTPNIKQQVAAAKSAMGMFDQLKQELNTIFGNMSGMQLKGNDVESLLAGIFPVKEETEEKGLKTKMHTYRDEVKEIFESSDIAGQQTELTRGTAYGLYQATTYWESHVKEYSNAETKMKKLAFNNNTFSKKMFSEIMEPRNLIGY